MLALGLIALGVFMGFVLYGFGSPPTPGGGLGHGLSIALGWSVGRAKTLAPVALVAGGGVLLMRPLLPALRPLRTGSICLAGSIVLALAAGTLGVSAGQGDGSQGLGRSQWSASFLDARGGALGQLLYDVTHRLVQQVGVDILVVFLFIVGVTLLTGASLATILRATGSGVVDSTRILRARVEERRGEADLDRSARAKAKPAAALEDPHSLLPPDPEGDQLIVRATHVEAPPLDDTGTAAGEDPWDAAEESEEEQEAAPESDLVSQLGEGESESEEEEAEEESLPGVAATDPSQLTPQGRLRDVVTDDPDFVWKMPDGSRVLTRSTAEQVRPDTAGQERTAASLVEALGHFGVQAKVIGTVAGPHITRYELRLAPGTKVGEGGAAQRRPRVRAGGDRHPHPRADPRQAGGRRRGPQREAADRAPRRRLSGAAGGLVAADGVAGQGRRRPGDRRGPREDAAPAGRGHDRRGQVGCDQRDARERAAAREPARTAARAGRPQAGGAQPLRVDPAPA